MTKDKSSCIFQSIIEDMLSNLVTFVISSIALTGAYLTYYYFQRSNFMKNIRRYMKPSSRVFSYSGEVKKFRLLDKSLFNRILSSDEQNTILAQDAKRKNLFNGNAVRLDDILEDGTALLSVIGFFDFLTTNLVVKPASRSKKTALGNLYSALFSDEVKKARILERRVKAAVYCQKRRCFRDILVINELANIVTVSVLIEDITGRVLIVHRGSKVAISSGNFAVSCAGSVSDVDLAANNPFLACAYRELKEELGLDCNLQVDKIVISKQKLQPAILISGKIDCRFENVYETMISAPDFSEENSELFAVPKNVIAGVVKNYQFTDVAAFQLAGSAKWWILTVPKSIEQYRLG